MKAELVFNNLSVAPAHTVEEARHWFSNMLETIADLIEEDVCMPVLHSDIDLYEISFMSDYGCLEWINDSAIDRELRLFMQRLTTQKPVQDHLKILKMAADEFDRSEFKLETHQECRALGVALLNDGIAVSLPSSTVWQHNQITIIQYLYDATLENPYQILHQVRHVSYPEHVDAVIRSWRHGFAQKITSAQTLMRQWETVFPYLDQCLEFEKKILSYLQGETLRSALDRLWQLDETCHHWKTNQENEPFYPMDVHPETSETMKIFAKDRVWTCPHQGQQYFVIHCYIQPTGYRLYWFVNRKLKKFTIGYIGPHLPTKKYPKGQ